MKILGIETSCDETSAAVWSDGRVLSNIVLSQDEVHAPYGGIVPELASRQHIKTIGYIVSEGLSRTENRLENIDAFAVTQGPGLIGSLLVGLSFAKGLAYSHQKPLVPIDHLEAHLHAALIENPDIPFPALALLVSGGHTSLFLQQHQLDIRLIGSTRDDAAGEALDKIAKFLDLGYPGGPIIDKLAENGDPTAFAFALPHMRDGSNDYSFSGFKTAAIRYIKQERITREHPDLHDFLASFENSIIRSLLRNLDRAAQEHKPRSLILCGGVARNRKLRRSFTSFAVEKSLGAFIPAPEFCTDNAAMVAALAGAKLRTKEDFSLDMTLNAYARR